MGIPIFKYEKIELLVCIYEISRELVFKYGISGCSRCLTPVSGNHNESYPSEPTKPLNIDFHSIVIFPVIEF